MNGNGKVNGAGASQSIQVNPVECARAALMFLSRANFVANERQAFDLAEGLLRAIIEGQCVLAPPPQPEPPSAPQPDAAQ